MVRDCSGVGHVLADTTPPMYLYYLKRLNVFRFLLLSVLLVDEGPTSRTTRALSGRLGQAQVPNNIVRREGNTKSSPRTRTSPCRRFHDPLLPAAVDDLARLLPSLQNGDVVYDAAASTMAAAWTSPPSAARNWCRKEADGSRLGS
jgi:hypothetical protein